MIVRVPGGRWGRTHGSSAMRKGKVPVYLQGRDGGYAGKATMYKWGTLELVGFEEGGGA
jgi:hypothetical protein